MWLVIAVFSLAAAASATPCEEARMRCAYRAGCGAALNNYMMYCNDLLTEPATICPKRCEYALIALTSSEEGKQLMNCQCEDEYCEQAKSRVDICRPQVLKGAKNATSSCRLSQLICLADGPCSAALGYYHQLCRSMYKGRKCSNKCLNSIEILRKQEKAAALMDCTCGGDEDYDCPRMQNNLARLCFHKHKKNHDRGDKHKKEPPNQEVQAKAASSTIVSTALIVISVFCRLVT